MTTLEDVLAFCERQGYGFTMQQVAGAWARKDPAGALVTGPCRAFTVECPHETDDDPCHKCYGCGWTFRKMKRVKS